MTAAGSPTQRLDLRITAACSGKRSPELVSDA
jgi:hypothetical protein